MIKMCCQNLVTLSLQGLLISNRHEISVLLVKITREVTADLNKLHICDRLNFALGFRSVHRYSLFFLALNQFFI